MADPAGQKLSTPSVPPLSLPVLITSAAKFGAAFGIYKLSPAQVDSLTELSYVLGGVFGIDVLLRLGRARFLGSRIEPDAPLPSADSEPEYDEDYPVDGPRDCSDEDEPATDGIASPSVRFDTLHPGDPRTLKAIAKAAAEGQEKELRAAVPQEVGEPHPDEVDEDPEYDPATSKPADFA